ncbi:MULTISPECIES: hypothetical protein [Streptomyces]|uniref:hypothetical protein n=1 Tax=Streptomyces TaxID=1883 RepID=UPI000B338F7A
MYRSVHAEVLASWTTVSTRSPIRAVRHIGADARQMASGLADREQRRVLGRVAGDERHIVGAVAALDRGEPCGLALDCAGTWVEWSARPVLFLPLVSRTGPHCAYAADPPGGFGAPLVPMDGFLG